MNPTPIAADPLATSFDIVARQDAQDTAISNLRSEVDEVKGRLDRVSRAAARPPLAGSDAYPSVELKGFVDGYLRSGRENELKSLSGKTGPEGGYARHDTAR